MGWRAGNVVTTIFLEERYTLSDLLGEKASFTAECVSKMTPARFEEECVKLGVDPREYDVQSLAFKRASKLAQDRFASECEALNKEPEAFVISAWNALYSRREPYAVTISLTLTYAEKVFP